MLYAAYTSAEGVEESRVFNTWEQYHAATFSPGTETKTLIPFEIHGRTYAERRRSVEETAARFSTEEEPGLSYGELFAVCNWFQEQGRRFGLLHEFHENGLI